MNEPASEPNEPTPQRRRFLRVVVTLVAVFVGCQALFVGLSLWSASVPEDRVAQQLAQDIHSGAYPQSNWRLTGVGGTFDVFTDCLVAGTGIGAPEMGIWERAVVVPRFGNCEGSWPLILRFADGDFTTTSDYLRYWAGYSAITKPAVALWGIEGMRAVSGGFLAAGAVVLWWGASRRVSPWFAAALMGPLVLSSDVMAVTSGNALHALMIGVALAGAAAALWAGGRGLFSVAVVALVSGSVYSFLDLLTNPPLAWALTAAGAAMGAAVTHHDSALRVRSMLARSATAAGLWMVGFGATWVVNWLLGAATVGWARVWDDVTNQVQFRLGGEHADIDMSFGQATLSNLRMWASMPLARVVAVAAVVTVVAFLALAWRRAGWRALLIWAAAAWPAVLVPVWYETLSNHSLIHAWFTYRSVPVAVGIGVAAAVLAAAVTRQPSKARRRRAAVGV